MNKNSLKVFELTTTMSLIKQYIAQVFWTTLQNVQDRLSNMYKTISTALTWQNITAKWQEILSKITGNSLSVAENYHQKENIFLRMWNSTETIRGTLYKWADNAAQAFSNALAAIGGAIMYALTIPGKIADAVATAWHTIV